MTSDVVLTSGPNFTIIAAVATIVEEEAEQERTVAAMAASSLSLQKLTHRDPLHSLFFFDRPVRQLLFIRRWLLSARSLARDVQGSARAGSKLGAQNSKWQRVPNGNP